MKELSERFIETRGQPVELDGRVVHPIFVRELDAPDTAIEMRWREVNSHYPAGVVLKATKGEIEVNGQRHTEVVLWNDTSPRTVELLIHAKKGAQFKAWNVWRVDDLVQAWVGNAGIVITESGNSVTLECSNGPGEPNFSDTVVQLTFST